MNIEKKKYHFAKADVFHWRDIIPVCILFAHEFERLLRRLIARRCHLQLVDAHAYGVIAESGLSHM